MQGFTNLLILIQLYSMSKDFNFRLQIIRILTAKK